MSQWRDLSKCGACFSLDGDGSVGSLRAGAFWSGMDQCWEWYVERVNKTGFSVLASGCCQASVDAMTFAEDEMERREEALRRARAIMVEMDKRMFFGEGRKPDESRG